jgi:hypothetical protein
MEFFKICPACGEENPASEVICRVCMTNLGSVSPTKRAGERTPEREEPPETRPGRLTLARTSDGISIQVSGGSLLGRSGDLSWFFRDMPTVSRRHARVEMRVGEWRIEDLGSLNGTWVNGGRIEPGKAHPLKEGDTVALGMACEMKVIA